MLCSLCKSATAGKSNLSLFSFYWIFPQLGKLVRIGCVPAQTPPGRKNKLSNQLFLQEFPEFLTQFAGSHSDLVLLGDFNFHYDDCADTQVSRLKAMLMQ